jgi:hypothetical protein
MAPPGGDARSPLSTLATNNPMIQIPQAQPKIVPLPGPLPGFQPVVPFYYQPPPHPHPTPQLQPASRSPSQPLHQMIRPLAPPQDNSFNSSQQKIQMQEEIINGLQRALSSKQQQEYSAPSSMQFMHPQYHPQFPPHVMEQPEYLFKPSQQQNAFEPSQHQQRHNSISRDMVMQALMDIIQGPKSDSPPHQSSQSSQSPQSSYRQFQHPQQQQQPGRLMSPMH